MNKEVHLLQLGQGDVTLCNKKLVIENRDGKSVSEIYGGAFTFTKSEVTCEKCLKIINTPYSRFGKK